MNAIAVLTLGALLFAPGCRPNPPIPTPEAAPMTPGQKLFNEAEASIKKFEAERNMDYYADAMKTLPNVNLQDEPDLVARARLRSSCLSAWMQVVRLFDRFYDPAYNPDRVPMATHWGLMPQPTTREQAERRERQKAEARAYARWFNLQSDLRADEALTLGGVVYFIRHSYTSSAQDQAEVQTALDGLGLQSPRRAKLLRLLSEPELAP